MFLLDEILDIGKTVLDKFIPDANVREEAKKALTQAALDGELKPLELRMSAILAEAKSADPWTSRARPTFLYVIYLMILFSVPMGILSVFDAGAAEQVGRGAQTWLGAIPGDLWALFGAGYLGYAASRTVDKWGDKRGDKPAGRPPRP